MEVKSERTDNGDGTYTQTNKTVNTKTEDGYQITYETIVTSVYDTDGNLLSTKKEGPYEVSKEKISSSEDPSKVTIAGSLDEEYARVSTSVTYDTQKASELLAKNKCGNVLQQESDSYLWIPVVQFTNWRALKQQIWQLMTTVQTAVHYMDP